jgi:hypothetical protein
MFFKKCVLKRNEEEAMYHHIIHVEMLRSTKTPEKMEVN